MAVDRPSNNDPITKASVETMHDDARGLANAVPYDGLGIDSLGEQHLPSLLVGATPADYLEVTAAETVDITNPFSAESLADIRANWKQTQYLLNNGGPGYTLPPCKVFAFATLQITDVTLPTWAVTLPPDKDNRDNALYLVLGREDDDDTGVFHCDEADIGVVFVPQNKTGKDVGDRYSDMQDIVTIATVIDKTGNAGDWVLEKLVVKAASANHGVPTGAHSTFTIRRGAIGFFALYRDS